MMHIQTNICLQKIAFRIVHVCVCVWEISEKAMCMRVQWLQQQQQQKKVLTTAVAHLGFSKR